MVSKIAFLLMLLVFSGCQAKPIELGNEPCLTVSSVPIQDISKLSECQYKGSGPTGVCLSAVSAPPSQVDRLAKCGKNMVCLPKTMAKYGVRLPPPLCTSMIGLEGRCMSLVIPEVRDQEAFLPRDICSEDELCVPCFDPQTGEDTSACTLAPASCNAGPMNAPYVLECPYTGPAIMDINKLPLCEGCPGTHCLPASRVPEGQKSMLTECEDADGIKGYCTPDKSIVAGGMYVPAGCRTPDGSEGRCLPPCLPTIKAQDYGIWQMDCPDGEVCAPCYDPTTLEDTGACWTAPCDKPAESPKGLACPYDGPPIVHIESFAPCSCPGTYCAPEERVPENQKSLLDPCDGGFCVPQKSLESGGNYVPPTCRTPDGSEGRCMSRCLPDVRAQEYGLWQMDCQDDEVCAPCYDPTTGEDTGSCRSAPCDAPAEPPKELQCPYDGLPMVHLDKFQPCECAGTYCAPEELVPDDQKEMLEICDGGFCVPDKMLLSGGNYVPPTCHTPDGAEGRCLSMCLPDIKEQEYGLWQMDCPDSELCAPCYDPRTGEDTGSCYTAPCDAPAEPAQLFECPYSGPPLVHLERFDECGCAGTYCASEALVPTEQRDLLEKCDGGFCVPKKSLEAGGNYVPPTCRTPDGAEGRCLSKCLPDIKEQEYGLWQMDCADDEVCAPCYDPRTGEDTGSCYTAPCDAPAETAQLFECPYDGPPLVHLEMFEECGCSGTYCASEELVPEEQRGLLEKCDAGFCVPKKSLEGGGNYVPPTCRTPDGSEGRCMSTCLPDIAAQDYGLWQMDCPDAEVCAPCYNPQTCEDTNSCRSAPCDSPAEACHELACPYSGAPVVDVTKLASCACEDTYCAPEELVSEDLRSQLDKCDGGYCVPRRTLEHGGNYVKECRAIYGTFEGRCQSVCLPAVSEQAENLSQEDCPTGEVCAPCYDPITGEDTQACRGAPCDSPKEEKQIFEYCYENTARCVPREMVPEADRGDLAQRTCPDDMLCVPNELVEDPDYSFPACSPNGEDGACVPMAVGSLDLIRSTLTQGPCPENHLCVPCDIDLIIFSIQSGACDKLE